MVTIDESFKNLLDMMLIPPKAVGNAIKSEFGFE